MLGDGCDVLVKLDKFLTLVRAGKLRANGDDGLRRRATMTTKAGRMKQVGFLNSHCPNIVRFVLFLTSPCKLVQRPTFTN